MAVMEVHNSSAGWLVLWLEPLGEDRWLRPGERFRIRSDYRGDDLAFSVRFWVDEDAAHGTENISVWVERGDYYAEVTDGEGDVVECGHQRPAEVHARWQSLLAEARKRTASRTSPKGSDTPVTSDANDPSGRTVGGS